MNLIHIEITCLKKHVEKVKTFYNSPMATLKSPTCGRVKKPQLQNIKS